VYLRPTQPSPLSGRKMSTSQSAVMLCGWGVKAGMVHSTCGWTCGWQVKLCDPSLTRAIPERFRDESWQSAIQIYVYFTYHISCVSVCLQLSEIGVELGFILDDLLSSDLNKLIQQAGDNQMEAVRHRAAVSTWQHDVLLLAFTLHHHRVDQLVPRCCGREPSCD